MRRGDEIVEPESEDPVVARWMECEDCGWKTRECGAHEDVPVAVSCPYCTYGGDVVLHEAVDPAAEGPAQGCGIVCGGRNADV